MSANAQWDPHVYRLDVARQIADTCTDWSDPVQYKFVKSEDGRLEMWLRTYNESGEKLLASEPPV
jgi:hypothetical protein